jgi:peroxiredoxin family protein
MANGARMAGIQADLFFTFFGLDAMRKDRYAKIKVAATRHAHADLDRRNPASLRSPPG